jgi:hypothetical protein
VPKGLVTLPDGSIDADYYTVNKGIHPDFVVGLKAIMAGTSTCHLMQQVASLAKARIRWLMKAQGHFFSC